MVRQLRHALRRIVDRFQFKPEVGMKKVGKHSDWMLSTKLLGCHRARPVLFSGGAGHDISFELEFIKEFNGIVYLYDPSETGWTTICNTSPDENLVCHRMALATGSEVSLAAPQDPMEGSWRLPDSQSDDDSLIKVFSAVSLVKEIEKYGYDYVDVVKLDIEGFEYQVLNELLDSKIYIKQLLVEFHGFLPGVGQKPTKAMKARLKKLGYRCFYKFRHDHSYMKTD